MEAVAGGAVADGVVDAVPLAMQRGRQAIRRRRTPLRTTPWPRATPKYPATATTIYRSSAIPSMRSTARPARRRSLPPATAASRARTVAIARAATADDVTADGTATVSDAIPSGRNGFPVDSSPRATSTAWTAGRPAAPAPSPMPILTSWRLAPSRSSCPANRSPSTARAAKSRPHRSKSRRHRPRLLRQPTSTPWQPAGMAVPYCPARRSRGAARRTRATTRVPIRATNHERDATGLRATLSANRDAMAAPAATTVARVDRTAAPTCETAV